MIPTFKYIELNYNEMKDNVTRDVTTPGEDIDFGNDKTPDEDDGIFEKNTIRKSTSKINNFGKYT